MPELLPPEERGRMQGQNQEVTQQRMLREMARALEALSGLVELDLLLEGIYTGVTFRPLELVSGDRAAERSGANADPLGTYRPADMLAQDQPLRTMKQELELHRYCRGVAIKAAEGRGRRRLPRETLSRQLIRAVEQPAAAIHERTDGNPLFAVWSTTWWTRVF